MLSKQEIRQLGEKEMKDELQRSRRELLKSLFDMRMGTSKETHSVKNMRRYIARLETIKKEAGESPKMPAAPATPVEAPKATPVKKAAKAKKAPTKSSK